MEAGFEEMKSEFSGLKDSILGLNGTLSETKELLAQLKAPMALEDGFKAAAAEASGMAATVEDVDKAAADIVTTFDNIGSAIDQDTAKMQTLLAEMHAAQDEMHQGAAFTPNGAQSSPQDTVGIGAPTKPTPEPEDETGSDAHGHKLKGAGDFIMEFLALASMWEGAKGYAEMQKTALQTAIIEGLSGEAAKAEANRIVSASYGEARLTRGDPDDIEQAYSLLLRQRLPKSLVDQMIGPLAEAATTYDTPVEDVTGPMFNLAEQFKIPGQQMTQAIAILGKASHEGHYWFQNFGTGLPEVSNQFARMGDTGLKGEIDAAAALETVMRGTNDAGKTSTDLSYLMTYLSSGVAARFFDRSKRSESLLGKPILDLFHKYNIKPLDLPKYMDEEQAKGTDPLDAMIDYMHSIGGQNMTPTDQMFVFNSLFHSTEAATAMTALLQNYDYYHGVKKDLSGIQPGFLDENFRTAIQGDAGQQSGLTTSFEQMYREGGHLVFGAPWLQGTWLNPAPPSQATLDANHPGLSPFNPNPAPLTITPNIPLTVNVHVDRDGNVKVDGGVTGGVMNAPPGTSVRVNQGNVLNGVH